MRRSGSAMTRSDPTGNATPRQGQAGAGRSMAHPLDGPRFASSRAARASRTSSARSLEIWPVDGDRAASASLSTSTSAISWGAAGRALGGSAAGGWGAAARRRGVGACGGVTRRWWRGWEEPCPACGGSGHINRKPCPECRGTGWARRRRNLEVKIPAGVDTGSRIRVAGEGAGGMQGGGRGDIYLRITVRPDPRFERKGDDLYVTLPVAAHDAALGTEIPVPTLKGQVSMKIPPETSSGRTFRLPGYGMPHLKGGGKGDEYVRVQLTIPSGLSPKERELYQELKNLRTE